MTKTNAMRLLDAAGIAYRTAEYEYDESDLSGKHAAEQLGMPAEQVFKTLVTRGDKTGLLVFCIPVLDELDRRPDLRQQEAGDDPRQGAAPAHGLHARRLLAHRHEEEIPHLDRRDVHPLRRDRRQRGHARRADHPGPGRPREVRGREGILNLSPI